MDTNTNHEVYTVKDLDSGSENDENKPFFGRQIVVSQKFFSNSSDFGKCCCCPWEKAKTSVCVIAEPNGVGIRHNGVAGAVQTGSFAGGFQKN
jgi:hypothetical protein